MDVLPRGLISFVTLRVVGGLVDHWGSFPVGTVASLLLALAFQVTLVDVPGWVPVLALFLFISSRSPRGT
jgi:hypothetical protein